MAEMSSKLINVLAKTMPEFPEEFLDFLKKMPKNYLITGSIWHNPTTGNDRLYIQIKDTHFNINQEYNVDDWKGLTDSEKANYLLGLMPDMFSFVVSTGQKALLQLINAELSTRGDYQISIPKVVDVLFKLGCVTPIEPEDTVDTASWDVEAYKKAHSVFGG